MTFLQQHSAYTAQQSNKMMYLIGVPAMLIGILMLLNWVSIDISTKLQISFAWILVIACCVYYFMLDLRLAAVATLFLVILTLIVVLIAGPVPSFGKLILAVILIAGGFAALYMGQNKTSQTTSMMKKPQTLIMIPLFFVYDLLELSGFKSTILKN